MSIIQPPGVTGTVLIGTVSGATLFSAPYEASGDQHVAPQILRSVQLCWDALPALLTEPHRYDFMVRQRAEGQSEEVATYWQSGLSAGALCGLIARRLRELRAAVQTLHVRPAPVEVTEVLDAIPWDEPNAVDRVRAQLEAIVWGEYNR